MRFLDGQSPAPASSRTLRRALAAAGLAVLALMAPAAARADGVLAQTGAATSLSGTAALLGGTVYAGNASTTYSFQYASAASTWCASSGTSGTFSVTATARTTADGTVTAQVSGLTPGAAYCDQLVATNASGTSNGGQQPFTVGLPVAATNAAVADTASTATVSAAVNPSGQSTTYVVQYGPQASDWCSSNGLTGTPAATTAPATAPRTVAENDQVTVDISELTPSTQYCAQVVATNGSGSAPGGQISFLAGAPAAASIATTITGAGTVTIGGQVYPAGQATTYWIQYDVSTSDWCSNPGDGSSPAARTPAQTLSAADDSEHDVSVTVSGLQAGGAYCAQVVAANDSAISSGAILQFTAGLPTVTTGEVDATGASNAVLHAQIAAAGQATSYTVHYDTATSDWCTADGAGGSPAGTGAATALAASDAEPHDVSVALTGLTPGTDYCATVVATNASGAAPGQLVRFTAGAPAAETTGVTPTAAAAATVSGAVNPAGQATTIAVSYDLSDSNWCSTGNGSAAHVTAPQTLPFTDASDHPVSVSVSGLTAGLQYCAEIDATNGAGAASDSRITFTAGVPTVTTSGASAPDPATATVGGTVNPAGASTSYQVAYDVATSDWCQFGSGTAAYTSSSQTLPQTDATGHAVSVGLSGLSAGTAYCAEVIATNASGTFAGATVLFSTPGPTAPAVTTGAASGVTASSATIAGLIDASFQATAYRFDYGPTTGYGSSTAPAGAGSGSGGVSASATLSGLAAGTTYHYRLEGTNASGTTYGADQTFTTAPAPAPPPPTTTDTTTSTDTTTTTTPPPTTTTTTTTTTTAAPAPVLTSAPTAATPPVTVAIPPVKAPTPAKTPTPSARPAAPRCTLTSASGRVVMHAIRGAAARAKTSSVGVTVTCDRVATVSLDATISFGATGGGGAAARAHTLRFTVPRTRIRARVATRVVVQLPAAALRLLAHASGSVTFRVAAASAG